LNVIYQRVVEKQIYWEAPVCIVAYLLIARTVEPESQPLLGSGCVICNNGVTVGSGVFYAVRAEAI
jgi:hypothetical protein